MKVLVSACLLGENCIYNGGNTHCPEVVKFLEGKEVLPICPEMLAGMGCPRTPMEIVNGVLTDRDGNNLDSQMRDGIERALEMLRQQDIQCAVLQSRSPTCGVRQVYDGSFSGKLVPGSGLFAQALREAGYMVLDAQDIVNGESFLWNPCP